MGAGKGERGGRKGGEGGGEGEGRRRGRVSFDDELTGEGSFLRELILAFLYLKFI